MNSKRIIIILVVVILVIVLVALLMNRKGSTPVVDNPNNPDIVEKKDWDADDYVPEIPENFTKVNQDLVVSETDAYAEAVAYYYDSGEKVTKVNVYLQNRGTEPISKDAVCIITLKEEGNDFEYIFGGVIENDTDIEVGGRSVIRTQFVDKTGEIVYAKIGLELPEPPVVIPNEDGEELLVEPEIEEPEVEQPEIEEPAV